jgi:nicotinamide-nucleotide adenylyltransferase
MASRFSLEQISSVINVLKSSSKAMLQWIRPLATDDLQKKKILAVLDSSFNPPTLAHLSLLQDSISHLKNVHSNDESSVQGVLMHSISNADKKVVIGASLEQRVDMLQRIQAVENHGIVLTNRALFVDKAQLLKNEWSDAKIYLIVGEDTLIRILDEKYYKQGIDNALQELFSVTDLICFARATADGEAKSLEQLHKFLQESEWGALYVSVIHLLKLQDDYVESLSSTKVRDAFMNRSVDLLTKMLPAEVVTYCFEENIYSS